MFSALRAHSSMDRQRRRKRTQQLPEVYKLISPLSEGIMNALKPVLVSAIALACCAPLPLPFFLLIALFRSQEFVVLQLHSQVHNSLCKMELPQSDLSKRSRELEAGPPHGTGCVGQQEKCGEKGCVRGCCQGVQHTEQGSQHRQLRKEGCTQNCEPRTDMSCKATPCCLDGWQSLSAHAWALFFAGLKESNSL